MNRFTLEVKVGLVVTLTVALVLGFLFLLGDYNPFTTSYRLFMLHNYVGGIENGSPVRVAGAKVGRVNRISFFEAGHTFQGQPVSLGLELLIDKRAKHLIRKDSKFLINFEGLIGGKYIEISPGTVGSPELEDGASVRGQDPPRLEQMLSQGFDVFNRLTDLLNELGLDDRQQLKQLLDNVVATAEDLRVLTGQARENLPPLLADARAMTGDLGPFLKETHALVHDLRNVSVELGKLTPEEKKAYGQKLDKLMASLDSLAATLDRLDRLSARLEKETAGLNKDEVERFLREFLQQEGITVNVGSIAGKPDYPRFPPPAKP